ncbi:PREDICTED: uncharacterized protein LOC108759488 [Trachymyrmex cornetzi]|uniref:uncharacterized protein LOC108759488 n=1 Tax=Trachymyrmex cornetzi TaxID=471704 RepID=UPI00084EEB19|nr:PREDICTED: uncharacterized protein LOC108759488 [Trachymyrmex cornetzi]
MPLLPDNQFGFRKFLCQDNLVAPVASIHAVQFVSQGSISEPRSTLKGTPQGSVLSPTLFNFYLRNVNEALDSDTELLQFADDIVIFSSLKDTEAAINSVELSLQGLESFLLERGLDISPTKTQLIIFSNKRSLAQMDYSISFRNQLILPSPTVRFLGVLLDPKLSGKPHMSYIINKGKRILQIIQALRDSGYLLRAIFLKYLRYNNTSLSTSCINFAIWLSAPLELTTYTGTSLRPLFSIEFRDLTSDSTLFYTDGSKVDHSTHVGAAVLAPQLQGELMLKLPPYTSVFSAEAYAIYTAITLAIDRKLPKATIITDSKSVLKAVKSFRNPTNNYLIPLIRSVLEEAESKGTEINFIWIPSHRGISGNEKADQLAKRAIRQESQADIKGSFYFSNIFKRSAKPWYFRINIPRESIVMINRLRSNHYNLNYSLHRKNLIDDPSCPCGAPQQDMIHMIYECPESRGSTRLAYNQLQ